MTLSRIILLALTLQAAPLRADPLSDYMAFETTVANTAAGMQAYHDLHAERARWKSETSRLQHLIDECNGCPEGARYQEELNYWKGTEKAFQQVGSRLADVVGMDPLVRNLIGLEGPVGLTTGGVREDRPEIDYINSPKPDWYADSPDLCQMNHEQFMACVQPYQDLNASRCGELSKVEYMCETGAFTEAEDYLHTVALRRAGFLVPEIDDRGHRVTVYYGTMRPGVDPRVPSGADLLDYFRNDPDRSSLTLQMVRHSSGFLEEAQYGRFRENQFSDLNRVCPGAVHLYKDQKRCPWIHALATPEDPQDQPYTLRCTYSRGKTYTFWLHEQPEFATSRDAKKLSPLLYDTRVADFCPLKERNAVGMMTGKLKGPRLARLDYTESGAIAAGPVSSAPGDPEKLNARLENLMQVIEAEGVVLVPAQD